MTPDARIIAVAVISIGTWLTYFLLGGPHTHPFFTMAVLARYSLAMGLLQLALGLIAVLEFPVGASLLQNIFILDNPGQLCHVTWMSLLLGTTILVTYRTTKINAPVRFRDYKGALDAYRLRPPSISRPFRGLWRRLVYAFIDPQRGEEDFWRRRWLYLFALSLPVPMGAFEATWEDMIQTGTSPGRAALSLFGNLVLGVAVWFAVMLLTTLLHQLFLNRIVVDAGLFPLDRLNIIKDRWRISWLDRRGQALARTLHHLGPGFSHCDPAEGWLLRSGHAQLAIYTTILMAGYVVSLLAMGIPREGQYFSALFGLLTMCLLVCLLTTGSAFLLDYFRIPLIVSVLLLSLFNWTVSSADCFYKLIDPSERVAADVPAEQFAARDPSYFSPLMAPASPGERPKTLVIVTAAGGGIQAAAWTARVLTGLHELYGNDFTRSVGIVSSVSGGSVGALFYLDAWSQTGHGLPEASQDDLRMIRERAMRSSLEATAWGWAGWDTVKSLAPFLVPTFSDRGWAIEKSWRDGLVHPDESMSGWGQRTQAGTFPIVIFNATAVENGKRFMISNRRLPKSAGFLERRSDDNDAIELDARYAPFDIPPVTAARLSATFPYVSPICRPAQKVADPYHIADGGYVDNEGVVSALDWLDHLVADRKAGRGPAFDRVLVIRIMPFPDDEREDKFKQGGWLFAFAGPAETIMNVRSSSQLERNHFGLAMMKKALQIEHIDFRVADFQFRRTDARENCLPLSWKLSRMEKWSIEDAWASLVEAAGNAADPENPIGKIDGLGWFQRK